MLLKIGMVAAGITAFSYSWIFAGVDAATAASVTSFGLRAGFLLLEAQSDRSGRHSILPIVYKSAKFAIILFVVVTTLGATWEFSRASDLVRSAHIDRNSISDEQRDAVQKMLHRLSISYFSLGFAVVMLSGYSCWKYLGTRIAESRLTFAKDLVAKVEKSRAQRDEAIDLCLTYVEKGLELTPWAVLRKLFRTIVPSSAALHVVLMVPGEKGYQFSRYWASRPEMNEPLAWLMANHQPSYFDEQRLNALIGKHAAEGALWRKKVRDDPERARCTSAAGFVGAKGEPLAVDDARKCPEFDSFVPGLLKQANFKNKQLDWLDVRSFIGYPVDLGASRPGVLFVSWNVRYGFAPEDREIVELIADLLGRVLH